MSNKRNVVLHLDTELIRKTRCRVAKSLKEDHELIEAGFEHVTEREGIKIYRKRK